MQCFVMIQQLSYIVELYIIVTSFSDTHLEKLSGRPQVARCILRKRFSRSMLVSPMRS